jgi:hypothetical protein
MNKTRTFLVAAFAPLLLLSALSLTSPQTNGPTNTLTFTNGAGADTSITTAASFDANNPFFQPIGSNARACSTCHQPNNGWSIRTDSIQERFDSTDGLDPIFLTNDGTDSPMADMSTVDTRRQATTMLRGRGTIRVGLPIPSNAEFDLVNVNDPYWYASASELSLFRKPLPTTNLKFTSSVMWDNRETLSTTDFQADLRHQGMDAVLGHAQGQQSPSADVLQAMVDFETCIFTTQVTDAVAGDLTSNNAQSGPQNLAAQPFHLGINDPFGNDPANVKFNPNIFSLFTRLAGPPHPKDTPAQAARKAIGRGQQVFNSKLFTIADVQGLNDVFNKGNPIKGTCGTCHNTPNVGSHSLFSAMNTGISDPSLVARDSSGTAGGTLPSLPLYRLRNKTTGRTITTTDPGMALVTGKWNDINKFKVPSLRGLETRSPYMHNGFTGEIDDVLDFYARRFNFTFSGTEKSDLKAFLEAL